MNNYSHRYPRKNSPHKPHPHRFHHSTPRRVVTPQEKQFLAGVAINPAPRIILENGSQELTVRAMDLICPIGMGQRGLIVSPPGSGKTTLLKHICMAVSKAYPDIEIYCLLIDERPEEVTDFRRAVDAEVRFSSMDQTYDHHIEVAETTMNDAFKSVAAGRDVMILIDSLTRLARVHNSKQRGGGRTLSGGVDAQALEVPRRIFGAARNIQDGGSLSILATILVETESRMDDVIFEEFKGTGNMEIVLAREISSRRIFPAIDVSASNTRKLELLLEAEELKKVDLLRRGLAGMSKVEAIETLIKLLQKYPTNNELLYSFKSMPE
ncbi:MAG: transcription termination factor Rho [Candidatus Omnitrophica bacterium]|nr:transcription termination factor Rho [Candidatus Omnitrophota bacterium]